jgi:hypothetical protein
MSPMATKRDFPWAVPRGVQWAIAVGVALAWVFGPPLVEAIVLIAAGVYIMVWGPKWERLWLATIIGVLLLMFGLLMGLLLLS